jgi:aryl-alcohol dehydrogenase-like predicted oxidoreductase
MAYGAFNAAGQPPSEAVAAILDLAQTAGVTTIDTARAYGESERMLGSLAAADRFSIVTKVPALDADDPVAMLEKAFAESLVSLRTKRVHALLLHRAADLLGSHGSTIWQAMVRLKANGLVEKIGFSGHGPEETLTLLDRYPVEIVQLPFNIFDHRHLDAGVLARCTANRVTVHTRSAFLQGFALARPEELQGHLAAWRSTLDDFQARCRSLGLSPLQGALRHVLDCAAVDQVVVGVDDVAQLQSILVATSHPPVPGDIWLGLQCDDLALIDPSRWF